MPSVMPYLAIGVGPEARYGLLWWPAGAGILWTVALLAVYPQTRERIDNWLKVSRQRRNWMTLLFVVLTPLAVALLVDWVDVSELAKGSVSKSDAVLLVIVVTLAALTAWWHLVYAWHDDKWNQRLEQAEAQRRQEVDAVTQSAEIAKGDAAVLRKTLDFLTAVGRIFNTAVAKKTDRVRKAAAAAAAADGGVDRLGAVRLGLKPRDQVAFIIVSIQNMLAKRMAAGTKMRVSVFRLGKSKHFESFFSWDGETEKCLHSGARYPEKFRVDSQAASTLLVYASHRGKVELVEDARVANDHSKVAFHYFDEHQEDRIQSVAVFPVDSNGASGRRAESGPITDLVCIDTDERGYFAERDRKEWELFAEYLARFLLLEREIEELIGSDLPSQGQESNDEVLA